MTAMTDSRTDIGLTLCLVTVLLWTASPVQGQSLFTDPTAQQTGDVVTIVLAEQTSAQRESSYEGESESAMGGNASVSSPALANRFAGDAQITTATDNRNQSMQSGVLEGTVTARVVDVNEAGNLRIEGKRRLTINGVTHVMEVSGLVRPTDVRHDNTVLSHQIANAQIKYGQDGFRHSGFLSKGLLLRVGSVLAIGFSIFLGLK